MEGRQGCAIGSREGGGEIARGRGGAGPARGPARGQRSGEVSPRLKTSPLLR